MSRLCLVLMIALFACEAPPPTAQDQADAETRSACRNRAEQAYEQQNRGEIFSPASEVNSPYSANYLPSVTDRGLADQFVHDRMVSDCIRNTGTQPAPVAPATPVLHP